MLEASDICDDITDESIGAEDEGIGAADELIDESIGADDDIDMSMDEEDDWAKAPEVSTTITAVPAISRRIISSLHLGCPAGGFEATTNGRPSRSAFSRKREGMMWRREARSDN